MNPKRLCIMGALGMIVVIIAACGSPSRSSREPTRAALPSPAAAQAAGTSAAPQTTDTARPTAVVPTAPVPTPTAAAQTLSSFEEDCMAICHIPDPNENFGAGATALPVNHQGRTTCLECHAQGKAPALPDTHLGRLDVSCAGCHK